MGTADFEIVSVFQVPSPSVHNVPVPSSQNTRNYCISYLWMFREAFYGTIPQSSTPKPQRQVHAVYLFMTASLMPPLCHQGLSTYPSAAGFTLWAAGEHWHGRPMHIMIPIYTMAPYAHPHHDTHAYTCATDLPSPLYTSVYQHRRPSEVHICEPDLQSHIISRHKSHGRFISPLGTHVTP